MDGLPTLPITGNWLVDEDASDLGDPAPDSIRLGRIYDPNRRSIGGRMLYGGERHVLAFGPNGSGKGSRVLVPNLLQCHDRSFFVIDPKGELAAITAPWRRKLGRVVILNPFNVVVKDFDGYGDLKSDGYNPLVLLNPDLDSFNADATSLAEAIIKVEGKDKHWDESAHAMVAMLMMYATVEARSRGTVPTLARVRELMCMYSEEARLSNDDRGVGIPALARRLMDSPHVGLRNKAAQFADWTPEIKSIRSTLMRHTTHFDDAEILRDTAKTGFRFDELKERPTTVYCILPPEKMKSHSIWLRLMLTSAMKAVLRPRKRGEPRVMFMLDEFAALGHLDIIQSAWSLVRGYGVQMMPVVQSLTQIKRLYPNDWENFVANAGAVTSFAVNDQTTAEWISARAGQTTTIVSSYHRGESISAPSPANRWLSSTNESTSINYTQMRVPLIDPHRLYGLPPGGTITSLAGEADIVAGYAPDWWDIVECRERARDNPYYLHLSDADAA